MTPEARETLRRLAEQAEKNHGAQCRNYARMPPSLATSNCAGCGGSSTAHVVTKLCDELTALLDALEAREWAPIETAPKDGTLILATAHDWDHPCVLSWAGRWDDRSGDTSQDYAPTHWMLLPPTPSPEEK
jgi:hypothetical protein